MTVSLEQGTAFFEKHWKVVIYIAIIVLVIVFWKDISNVFSNLFSGLKSLTNPLGNPSNDQEVSNANAAITAQDQAVATPGATATNPYGNPFTHVPWTTAGTEGDTLLDDSWATQLAQQINSSIGTLSSSASKALAAFQQAPSQMDVSHIAAMYANTYQSQMWDDMSTGYLATFNKEILAQIITYVNGLPVYYGG